MTSEIGELARSAKVYDLAQPYFVGMPHYPTHPPFLFSLTKLHGEIVGLGGVSSAADSIALSGHCGTHMDALGHFSRDGFLHDGMRAAQAQDYSRGLRDLGIETVEPVVRRGVLLDIARSQNCDTLPRDFEITPEHLAACVHAQRVGVQAGDVVLLRTGWARFWNEPARFVSGGHGPGPGIQGARWLSERQIFAAGSDTISFEKVPDPAMPVHVHLLVERGIHIIECLSLEELARDQVYSFLFIAAPLKIVGGTGSPIRPIALTLQSGA